MYRVIVADDEPIILSGISHLADWSALDCRIVASCRNGKEALEAICREDADIVITDIKMPVMDGFELVRQASASHPRVVFIILTSLEEFRLVKKAIQYAVCDYIVKTELDEKTLCQAVMKAKGEADKRREIYKGKRKEKEESAEEARLLVENLFLIRNLSSANLAPLQKEGFLDSYALVTFYFSYPESSDETLWSSADYHKLFDWEGDIIAKILPSLFPKSQKVTSGEGQLAKQTFFLYGLDEKTAQASLSRLRERVVKASALITRLGIFLEATGVYKGVENLSKARDEMARLEKSHYLGGVVKEGGLLNLDGIYSKVENDIMEKNLVGLAASFRLAERSIRESDHDLPQISFFFSALRSAIRSAFETIGVDEDEWLEETFSKVPFICTRTKALAFLSSLQSELEDILSRLGRQGGPSSPITDRARAYVLDHISEKISLSDVADYAGVSVSYMSKSFKKVMKKSLVDYINSLKVARAKEIMQQLNYTKVNEIATVLGFDNIYYFSKVFKKVTGQTPSDYMKSLKKKDE